MQNDNFNHNGLFSFFVFTDFIDVEAKTLLVPTNIVREPSPALPHEGDDLKTNGFFASICGSLCRDNSPEKQTDINANASNQHSVITSQCKCIKIGISGEKNRTNKLINNFPAYI